jgi:hypothetical protein
VVRLEVKVARSAALMAVKRFMVDLMGDGR